MSARRLSLKSPPVIAAVGIGLVVVVVINLRTFGVSLPGAVGGRTQRTTDPPAPVDLQLAGESMVPLDRLLAAPAAPRPDLARDPFGCRKAAPRMPATEAPRDAVAVPAKPRSRPGELFCSAVLLGGERPLALIDGRALGVGERVRGYEVREIGPTGVLLAGRGDKTLRLPVGTGSDRSGSFRVVTSLRSPADQGATSLAEQRQTERKPR